MYIFQLLPIPLFLFIVYNKRTLNILTSDAIKIEPNAVVKTLLFGSIFIASDVMIILYISKLTLLFKEKMKSDNKNG